MDRAGAKIAVYAHDVDLEPIASMLNVAGIRVLSRAEDGAIHIMHYGNSIAVIPEPESLPAVFISLPLDSRAVVTAIRTAAELNQTRRAVNEAKELLDIARLLGSEHERRKLYHIIVLKARELTRADSGTLFEIETHDNKDVLRFTISQTGPHNEESYINSLMPLSNTSIAGSVALSGKPVRLNDVYTDAAAYGLHFDKSFDEKSGYRTKSMLCVPLTSYTGNVVGVLQVMNRKPTFEMPLLSAAITQTVVEPFDDHDEELIGALGSHAALALRNAQLVEDLWTTKGLEGKNPLERT